MSKELQSVLEQVEQLGVDRVLGLLVELDAMDAAWFRSKFKGLRVESAGPSFGNLYVLTFDY